MSKQQRSNVFDRMILWIVVSGIAVALALTILLYVQMWKWFDSMDHADVATWATLLLFLEFVVGTAFYLIGHHLGHTHQRGFLEGFDKHNELAAKVASQTAANVASKSRTQTGGWMVLPPGGGFIPGPTQQQDVPVIHRRSDDDTTIDL